MARQYEYCKGRLEAVLWVVHVDPAGETDPLALNRNVNYAAECGFGPEYLFSPYSVFKVLKIEHNTSILAGGDDSLSHVSLHISAAQDSAREPEDLPLAPGGAGSDESMVVFFVFLPLPCCSPLRVGLVAIILPQKKTTCELTAQSSQISHFLVHAILPRANAHKCISVCVAPSISAL